MIEDILHFIKKEVLFAPKQKIIVAVSGGKDSMALLHFLQHNNFNIIAAHCNFNLRNTESDADALFVKKYCKENEIPYLEMVFNTADIAKNKALSVQETARQLRYDWFEKIRKEQSAVAVATAHHLDDNIETVLFKLTKGTGLKGIRGMKAKSNNIVRPFLQTPLSDILAYIKNNNVQYREDSSNKSNKYDRNKLRQEVTPVLKEINKGYYKTFMNHFNRWNDIENFYTEVVDFWERKLVKTKGEDKQISINALLKVKGFETLLHEILSKYGFNTADIADIISVFSNTEHKIFNSENHRVLVDKKFIYITALSSINESTIHYVNAKQEKLTFEKGILRIVVKPIGKLSKINKGTNYAYIDADKLEFPLTLRKWKDGDYFYPFGMPKNNGKPAKKKISKFLKDEKIDARLKEQTWVLCSGSKIVWVVNHRIDERFALSNTTKNVIQIKLV